MKVGSLFSGCLGLDLGLEAAGWEVAWACESDPACRRVIERRRPDLHVFEDVRDLGGATEVDLIAGGFPCQDLSQAGAGAGLSGERSGLWYAMADAIREIRPRLVLIENVPGLNTKTGSRPGESALGTVIADLAEAGYVGSWIRLRASAVGAPHIRERIFILAADAGRLRRWEVSRAALGDESSPTGRAALADHILDGVSESGLQAADAPHAGGERFHRWGGSDAEGTTEEREDRGSFTEGRGSASPDADSHRWDEGEVGSERGLSHLEAGERGGVTADSNSERCEEHGGSFTAEAQLTAADGDREGREDVADAGGESGQSRSWRRTARGTDSWAGPQERDRHGHMGEAEQGAREGPDWGLYEPAIRRWEYIFGRPAPDPTDDRGRLMPEFVEWMLGFPADWTAGESRTARLRMLGNAVQVQCGEEVGRILMEAS